MGTYSTTEAAKKCGIHPITLQRWVSDGKLSVPSKRRVGGVVVRIWTEHDLEMVRRFKTARYRKGRGRKKKKKA